MADEDWGDFSSSPSPREDRGRGGGRGRGRGSFNRNNDFQEGGDSWGNNDDVNGWGGVGGGEDRQEVGGRGRGRGGRGRGGGRFANRNGNGGDGDFGGGDVQPPVFDKPRPTYIPPEIDDNNIDTVEVGMNFKKYEKIKVQVSGDSVPQHIESFKSSGLREVLIKKLIECKYNTPTPIQKYSIPIIINGRDMMASAQTGSGKTVSLGY